MPFRRRLVGLPARRPMGKRRAMTFSIRLSVIMVWLGSRWAGSARVHDRPPIRKFRLLNPRALLMVVIATAIGACGGSSRTVERRQSSPTSTKREVISAYNAQIAAWHFGHSRAFCADIAQPYWHALRASLLKEAANPQLEPLLQLPHRLPSGCTSALKVLVPLDIGANDLVFPELPSSDITHVTVQGNVARIQFQLSRELRRFAHTSRRAVYTWLVRHGGHWLVACCIGAEQLPRSNVESAA